MLKFLQYTIIGIILSCYYFSFGLTFIPENINTKMILACVGISLSFLHATKFSASINKYFFYSVIIAIVYSLICFIATDLNNTSDYSYSTYVVSFFVWFFSAYATCFFMKCIHGRINLDLLIYYLAGICVAQCVIALLIDNSPALKSFVNAYINQGQEFLDSVDRLYGIGASIDNAGIRFCIVLILISYLLGVQIRSKLLTKKTTLLVLAFLIITVVGNMLSRTTIIGSLLGILYILLTSGIFSRYVNKESLKFISLIAIGIGITFLIVNYFYHENAVFHKQIRFAFEGFFNWYELGEWKTGSTDKLNRTMWIWPQDTFTWTIGTGLFENWIFNTDIGYCRLILYSGLIGFSVFSFFFIYNGFVFWKFHPNTGIIFLFLIALTFIVWVKVSTDIFIIYALIYALQVFRDREQKGVLTA